MKILIKTVRYGKNVLFYRADFDQNVNQKIKIFYWLICTRRVTEKESNRFYF